MTSGFNSTITTFSTDESSLTAYGNSPLPNPSSKIFLGRNLGSNIAAEALKPNGLITNLTHLTQN